MLLITVILFDNYYNEFYRPFYKKEKNTKILSLKNKKSIL